MKISIIIPVYNVSQYIERCLNSVLTQNYSGALECILINDCTPDNSIEIVQQIIKRYGGPIHIQLVHHIQNKGLSVARNTGIQHATGDYLYFLDSDDQITPNCISELAELVCKYNDVDIVQGNIVVTDKRFEWLEISQYKFPEYTTDTVWIRSNMLTFIPPTAWNKLIKRSFILEHKLWFKEGIIHEDEHWKYFAHKLIRSIAFCNIPTYYYYINESSIMNLKFKDRSFQSWMCIFEEYLPTITKKNEYKDIILRIATFQKNLHLLENPSVYTERYNKFLKKQIHSKTIPLSIKFSFLYMLYPSLSIKILSKLFFRRSYKIIRQLEKLQTEKHG